jgi:hypothetical protein
VERRASPAYVGKQLDNGPLVSASHPAGSADAVSFNETPEDFGAVLNVQAVHGVPLYGRHYA